MARLERYSDDRGAVYVEFLIAFFPLFLLFLAICQLALLAAADAIVRHAAYNAARSAIVVLEDAPSRYDYATRGRLDMGDPKRIAGIASIVAKLGYGKAPKLKKARKKPVEEDPSSTFVDLFGSNDMKALATIAAGAQSDAPQTGARMVPILAAGYLPLIPLAPSARLVEPGSESLESGLVSPSGDQLDYAVKYTKVATAVTIHDQVEGEALAQEPIDPYATVTVRVNYAFHCSIPVVRNLMCRSLAKLAENKPVMARAAQKVPKLVNATARFKLLTATATLPNQGASYYSRDDD